MYSYLFATSLDCVEAESTGDQGEDQVAPYNMPVSHSRNRVIKKIRNAHFLQPDADLSYGLTGKRAGAQET